MNKKELIERIKSLKNIFGNKTKYVEKDAVIELISKLDEPQLKGADEIRRELNKPVVPQFVADWIKYCKRTGVELQHALNMEDLYFYNYANQKDDLKLKEFFETENNQDIFARSWLDGYEVEKESQYLVKIKATKHFLARDGLEKIFFSLRYKSWFTRKDLEQAGFGWVFSCEGVEVEEVE